MAATIAAVSSSHNPEVSGLWLYLIVRLALWVSAVGIAAIPALSAPGYMVFGYGSELALINSAHAFRDAVFVLVPAGAIALSSLFDFLFRVERVQRMTMFLCVIGLIVNIAVLISGLVGFIKLPEQTEASQVTFWVYSWLIGLGLAVSLLTEVWVVIGHEAQSRASKRGNYNPS